MYKITLQNITYTYGAGTPFEIRALDNVNLGFDGGMITGLLGHTGSGKSTLVQMLNGLIKPTEGRVLLDGADIWANPREIRAVRFRVGLVMQYPEYQLFEETIRADIAYGPKNMGLSEDETKRRVSEAAAFVGLGDDILSKSPFELSGGQKRRAAIAGVIAMDPEVLVLDEPAAGLDPRGREEILRGIKQYQRGRNSTVIIVSHSMEDMANYCDRLVVMNNGGVFMQGECTEIFSRAGELTGAGLDVPQITSLMNELRVRGIPVRTGIYTVSAAADEVSGLVGGVCARNEYS